MAWVLLLLENKGQDKRVESILVPCLDAGSNPAISTKKIVLYIQACLRVKSFFLYRMLSADWRDYEEIPIYHSSLHPSLLEGKELFFVQDTVGRLKGLQRNPDISTKSFSLHSSTIE